MRLTSGGSLTPCAHAGSRNSPQLSVLKYKLAGHISCRVRSEGGGGGLNREREKGKEGLGRGGVERRGGEDRAAQKSHTRDRARRAPFPKG